MAARLVVEFVVDGDPIPQGSKKGFSRRDSTIVQLVDDNKALLKPWRAKVTAAARAAHTGTQVEGPVLLVLEFRHLRPRTVKRQLPSVKPDVDKLMRAICDAVTDAGVWKDDAQVVVAHISKVYAERPGVQVRIGEFPEEKSNTK